MLGKCEIGNGSVQKMDKMLISNHFQYRESKALPYEQLYAFFLYNNIFHNLSLLN